MTSILILEDDFDLGRSWRAALEDEGYQVDLCFTGGEAIALIEDRIYDVVIVDLIIDSVAGVVSDGGQAFLRRLLEHPDGRLKGIPKIGVSGFRPLGRPDLAARVFRQYGAGRFLAKPFPPRDLVLQVKGAIAEREQEDG